LINFTLYIWTKDIQKDLSVKAWMKAIWDAIERVGSDLDLAFRMISDLPTHSHMLPEIFSRFIGFVCDSRKADRRKFSKLLSYAVRVANNMARNCSNHGDLDSMHLWRKQADLLKIHKML
jgi:hypothetical protein